MTEGRLKGWLVDLAVGGAAGGLVGGLVAVNLVIYSGIEDGYEASLVEVFQQSPLVGVITLGVLLGGPVAGVTIARRLRRRASPSSP